MKEKEKQDEFIQLAKPLMKWLCENKNPHAKIIIESDHAEILEGDFGYHNEEFILD